MLAKLRDLESTLADLDEQIDALLHQESAEPALPTAEEIKRAAAGIFTAFAAEDPEDGRVMHRLVPDLRVYPVRLCGDGVDLSARLEAQTLQCVVDRDGSYS